jgi:hypothetical protein
MRIKLMKVFQIGFGRTGTKSIASALRDQGFNVLDQRVERLNRTKLVRFWATGQLDRLMALAVKYDVVEDHPFSLIYKELRCQFPEARFIYSTRSPEKWLNSIVSHTLQERGPSESKRLIFGFETPIGHEAHYLELFERHRREVREFFRDDPLFLEVDLSQPFQADRIAKFLGIPEISLPMRNVSKPSTLSVKGKNGALTNA